MSSGKGLMVRIVSVIVVIVGLFFTGAAEANILCKWFGRCLYESPGFKLKVVDKETGQPLADVHALAEWVQYGAHGRNGPLIVQDALSSPDGVLVFPQWGPAQGSRAGLVINHDPVISLFKTGYKVLLLTNAVRTGSEATDSVRGFSLGIQQSVLEPFHGTPAEWIEELGKAAYPPTTGRVSDEQLLQFRSPYLTRLRRVLEERKGLPEQYAKSGQLFWHIDRDIKFYTGGAR